MIVRDLNKLYLATPVFYEGDQDWSGFEWMSSDDANSSVISFLRKGKDAAGTILVVGHYTPVTRSNYRVGVPYAGYWREMINSDAEIYGGHGYGNGGGAGTVPEAWNGQAQHLNLVLPGNSTLIFKFEG